MKKKYLNTSGIQPVRQLFAGVISRSDGVTPDSECSLIEQYRRLILELNQSIDKLDRVISINTYITNSLEKTEVLERILQQTRDLLNCERSSMLLVDKDDSLLKFAVLSREEEAGMLKGTGLRKGEGIAGSVWANGTPLIVSDPAADPRFSNKADVRSNVVTNSIIAVPLSVDDEIIGVIEGINKRNGQFDAFDLRIMQYISTQSAIAIKNAELYNMAIRDGMTRLYIHKYFRERLSEEFERCRRFNRGLSLVMADIDFFKKFNDDYGHQAGDAVICAVADCIRTTCRAADIPCRYGGEEFAVILPETGASDAAAFAERLRQRIEAMPVVFSGESFKVTVSVGVASYPESNPADVIEMIDLADKALYESKGAGRNRVTSS